MNVADFTKVHLKYFYFEEVVPDDENYVLIINSYSFIIRRFKYYKLCKRKDF